MNYVPGGPGALVSQSAETPMTPTVSTVTPPLQLQPTLQASTIQQVRDKLPVRIKVVQARKENSERG